MDARTALQHLDEAIEARRHLPGLHDQKDHGRRFHVPGDPKSGIKKAAKAVNSAKKPETTKVEAPKKQPTKAPAKVSTPKKAAAPKKRARTQKPPTKEERLRQWRADAAKPGRTSTGKTRRELYVEQWNESIAKAEKALADAQSHGDGAAVARYRSDLDYYLRSRAGLRANRHDPTLDEIATGGELAQSVNTDRPLAVYGDMLHIDGQDEDWMHRNLTELDRVPAPLHGVVAEGMAARADSGIWLGEGGVPGLDHAHHLHAESPRGWSDGKTFDDVNGVYLSGARQMLVGRTANSETRGAQTSSHEFGHALDDALGNASHDSDWERLHDRVVRSSPYLSPYYRQPGQAGRQEFWAEVFSTWLDAREKSTPYDRRATYILRLAVSGEIADELDNYFNRVAAKAGVK